MLKQVNIFVDGSCLGNPGPGGLSVILQYKSQEKKISAGYYFTTNNRMELMASIIALESLTEKCMVKITTDSQYVHLGITQWLHLWKKNGWKNKKTNQIKNIDLWKRLYKVFNKHKVYWHWIKGHANIKENIICDTLAKKAASNPHLEDLKYKKIVILNKKLN